MTAWTAPRTWASPEVVTESMLNTHVRDNELYLRERADTPHLTSTTAVGNIGAGPDDMTSYALPAGLLASDGMVLRFTAGGTLAANANAKSILIVFGATSFTLLPAVATSGGFWRLQGEIVRVSATTQLMFASINVVNGAGGTGTAFAGGPATQPTETLANSITFKTQANGTADNDVSQKYLYLEVVGG